MKKLVTESLERNMLRTIVNNLNHCADLPGDYNEEDDMEFADLVHLVKNVRKLVKDNTNMIMTIVSYAEAKNSKDGSTIG